MARTKKDIKDLKELEQRIDKIVDHDKEKVTAEYRTFIHNQRQQVVNAAWDERNRLIDTLSPTKRYTKHSVVDILDQGITATLGVIGIHAFAETPTPVNGTFDPTSLAGMYFAKINT